MEIFVLAAFALAMGSYYLLADLGGMWARHENRARARGIVALERTPEWERATRNSGWGFVATGVLLLLFRFWAAGEKARRSQSLPDWAKTTYYNEDGTQISDEEAERTGLKAGMEAADAKARR